MHEFGPESALPIYGDKTVSYTITGGECTEENPSGWEHIRIPVDHIDLVEDSQLRSSLWQQHAAQEANKPYAVFVFADQDNKFKSASSFRRGSLFDERGEDGVSLRERFQEAGASDRQMKEQKTGSWIRSLFSKVR